MKLIGFTFPPISVHRAYLEMGCIKKKKLHLRKKKKDKSVNQAWLFHGVHDERLSEMLVRLESKFLSDGKTNVISLISSWQTFSEHLLCAGPGYRREGLQQLLLSGDLQSRRKCPYFEEM